jgi:hypothetical protein
VTAGAPDSLSARWSAVRRRWRRADGGALATQALRRALRPVAVWQKLVFFERDLADELPAIRASLPLDLRVVDATELPRYRAALSAEGLDWAKLAARAALGHRCTVVLSAGRLVHLRWITEAGAWIPELRARLRPGPGEAYVYDAFTPEDLRGQQLQPAVACLMVEWGRRQGYARHLFYVRGNNAAGLRIVAKMRARRTAVVRCLRSKSGDTAWVTGLRPGRPPHLDFGDEARVRSLGPLGLWITHRRA